MKKKINKLNNPKFSIDRYEIIELVGIGGMSYVYKAKDLQNNKIVAIKVLKDELANDEEFINKFRTEAIASEKIKHENVVSAFDVVDDKKYHYIVMEFVDGITLDKYIKKNKRLSNEDTINFAIQIANGLKVAHSKGIIHRDIKPQNIVITNDKILKITDFGIARAISSTTRNISIIGTVHYISPEQARNENVDFRSDLYSLGCTMYQMITGVVPFQGDSPVSIILSHIRDNIKLPSIDNKNIYKSLEKIILKLTKMLPDERYQNADELITDLKKALEDKNGTFISDDIYNDNIGQTVIISDKDMKIIKEVSRNYINVNNNKKEKNNLNSNFINNYLHIIILTCIIIILSILFIFTLTKNKTIDKSSDKNIVFSNLKNSLPGVDIEIAKNLSRDYGINLNVVDSEYNDKYGNNQIIRILNEKFEPGDEVDVVISKGSEILDFSDIKKLNDTRFIDMVPLLEDRNLNYTVIEAYDNYVGIGKIIGVNKKNSSQKGELIFTISKGISDDIVLMPDLYNLTLQAASELLISKNLSVGNVRYSRNTAVEVGRVIYQSVEPNINTEKGKIIDLILSNGNEGEDLMINQTEKWVSQISTSYILTRAKTPLTENDTDDMMIIAIRLEQETGNGIKYFELSQPTEYRIGTTISLVYTNIQGEPNVETGNVQVVDVVHDEVLASYKINFKKK